MICKFTVSLATIFVALTLLDPIAAIADQPAVSDDEPSVDETPVDKPSADKRSIMDFQNLQHVNGTKASLSKYQQHYVVICFTSNSCPYSVDYEDRLKQLQNKFQQNKWSAIVVAINSNDHEDDSLEEMADRSKQQKFNFDYLKDEDQSVAKAFDAVYTPEFFVLDQKRQTIYQGALDDATKPNDVTINYVLKAIESHRRGDPIEVAKTGARGCRIRFQRRRKKQ